MDEGIGNPGRSLRYRFQNQNQNQYQNRNQIAIKPPSKGTRINNYSNKQYFENFRCTMTNPQREKKAKTESRVAFNSVKFLRLSVATFERATT